MPTPYQERKIASPSLNIGDEPYFEAAAKGKLAVKYCADCSRYHHYPRAKCPFCHSENTQWREASGKGTIYTYSITRPSGATPYAIAYVTLDEGPSMMTNIVDCDLDAIRIGQTVAVTFKPSENGQPIPMFKPV